MRSGETINSLLDWSYKRRWIHFYNETITNNGCTRIAVDFMLEMRLNYDTMFDVQ